MEHWQPDINEPCLMAIGDNNNPPHISFFELGKVVKQKDGTIEWVGFLGGNNKLNAALCVFKKLPCSLSTSVNSGEEMSMGFL